jgi:hypothetical protein
MKAIRMALSFLFVALLPLLLGKPAHDHVPFKR